MLYFNHCILTDVGLVWLKTWSVLLLPLSWDTETVNQPNLMQCSILLIRLQNQAIKFCFSFKEPYFFYKQDPKYKSKNCSVFIDKTAYDTEIRAKMSIHSLSPIKLFKILFWEHSGEVIIIYYILSQYVIKSRHRFGRNLKNLLNETRIGLLLRQRSKLVIKPSQNEPIGCWMVRAALKPGKLLVPSVLLPREAEEHRPQPLSGNFR